MAKLLKKIRATHILLIILTLVVFVGLFKTEVKRWNLLYFPKERVKTIVIEYSCEKTEENPKWSDEYERVTSDCSSLNVSQGLFDCYLEAEDKITAPKYINKDSTCKSEKYEWWFSGFGIYFFKTGDAHIGSNGYFIH